MCEQFSFCDVISYSPNNTLLNSIQELKNYLTSKGACICGLKLPFSVEEVFSFDPKVIGLQEQLDEEELRQHIYRQPTLIEPTSDGQQKVIGHVPMDSDSPPSEDDLPYDATALTISAGTAGKTENDIPFFAKMSSSSHSEVVSIIRNVDKCYQKVSPPELDNTRAPISTLNKGSELSENNIPTSTSEIVSEQVEVECSNPDEFEPTMLTENMCDEIIKAISTGIEEGKLSSVDCDAYEPLPNVDNINIYHNEYKIGTDFIESENLSIASPSKFPAFSLSPLTFPTEEFVSTPTLATPTSLLPVSGTTWTTTVSSHISASCLPTSLLGTTTSGPEPPSSILTPPNSASFHPDPFVTSPCSPSKSPSDMTSEIPISPQGVLDHIFSSDVSVRDTLSDPNALNSSLQAVYSSVVEISTSPPLSWSALLGRTQLGALHERSYDDLVPTEQLDQKHIPTSPLRYSDNGSPNHSTQLYKPFIKSHAATSKSHDAVTRPCDAPTDYTSLSHGSATQFGAPLSINQTKQIVQRRDFTIDVPKTKPVPFSTTPASTEKESSVCSSRPKDSLLKSFHIPLVDSISSPAIASMKVSSSQVEGLKVPSFARKKMKRPHGRRRDNITPTAEKMEDDTGCMSPSQVVAKNGSHPAEYAYSNKMTDGTSQVKGTGVNGASLASQLKLAHISEGEIITSQYGSQSDRLFLKSSSEEELSIYIPSNENYVQEITVISSTDELEMQNNEMNDSETFFPIEIRSKMSTPVYPHDDKLRSFSVDKIEERQEEITVMEEEIVIEKAREEEGLDNEGTMDGAETIDDAETMDEAETVHNTETMDDAEVEGREETEVEDGRNEKKKTAYTRKTHKQKKSFICESNAKLYEELKNCYQLDSIV